MTSIAKAVQLNRRYLLHYALTQQLVFSGEQLLHEIVTAFIRIARGAGEMMIDSHPGGAANQVRNRKNFLSRFQSTSAMKRSRTITGAAVELGEALVSA